MKILQLVSSLGIGGAEKFVADLSIELAKNNNVWVCVLDNAEDVGKDKLYAESLLGKLEANGVKVHFVGSNARKSPFKVLKTIKSLLAEIEPDIIHSHLLIWSLFLSFCSIKGKPHIFTQHIHFLKYPWIHKYYMQHFINAYVSICDDTTESIKKSLPSAIVQKIVNGIDPLELCSSRKFRKNGPTNLITISRLSDQKNLAFLICSLARIREKNHEIDFRLSIVGQGPLENDLRELVRLNNLEQHISFLGTRSDVPHLLQEHDVFVMPSRFEGFSIALIEALCSGITILATKVGGNAEILGQGVFGVLVDEGDAVKFDQYLLDLIINPSFEVDNDLLKEQVHYLSIDNCQHNHHTFYKDMILSSKS